MRTLVPMICILGSLSAAPVEKVRAFGLHELVAGADQTPRPTDAQVAPSASTSNAPKSGSAPRPPSAAPASAKPGPPVTPHAARPGGVQARPEGLHSRSEAPPAETPKGKSEPAVVRESQSNAGTTVQELHAELQRVTTDLMAIRQAAANAVQIQAERDKLQERVIFLERELEVIKRERQALANDQRQNWFLIGAGVLSGGLLLGLAIPRLAWRKHDWDSL